MPDTLFSQSYLDAGLKETEEYKQINNGGPAGRQTARNGTALQKFRQ